MSPGQSNTELHTYECPHHKAPGEAKCGPLRSTANIRDKTAKCHPSGAAGEWQPVAPSLSWLSHLGRIKYHPELPPCPTHTSLLPVSKCLEYQWVLHPPLHIFYMISNTPWWKFGCFLLLMKTPPYVHTTMNIGDRHCILNKIKCLPKCIMGNHKINNSEYQEGLLSS